MISFMLGSSMSFGYQKSYIFLSDRWPELHVVSTYDNEAEVDACVHNSRLRDKTNIWDFVAGGKGGNGLNFLFYIQSMVCAI